MFKHHRKKTAALAFGLVLIAGFVLFEPLTRHVVAVDGVCGYCHVSREYRSDVRLAYSKPHPPQQDDSAQARTDGNKQATCAECHLGPGIINSIYAYTHFASLTDLFGHFRDRMSERSGVWLPARQAAAYRVRDRLYQYDSPTCRHCHIEADIEPKRERGINAHKKALNERMTCIECHYNEKHRSVDLRKNAFAQVAAE